jgi:hypothetical protein
MDFLNFDEGISKIQENQKAQADICIEKRFCKSKSSMRGLAHRMRIETSDESGLLAYSSDMTNQKRFFLGKKIFFPGCLGFPSSFSLIAAWRERIFFLVCHLLREKLFSPSCLAFLFDFSFAKRKKT